MPVVTRVELGGPPRQTRDLPERLMVRWPRGWASLASAGQRLLRPRSRLRRAFLRREMISAYAAATRRDFELMLVRYSPEVEVQFDPELDALGLGDTFKGHAGLLRLIEGFGEAWEEWSLSPAFLIDLGDTFVALAYFHMPGTASGLQLDREFAQVLAVQGGVVIHEREFFGWDRGLRAAGLDPDRLALPRVRPSRPRSAATPG